MDCFQMARFLQAFRTPTTRFQTEQLISISVWAARCPLAQDVMEHSNVAVKTRSCLFSSTYQFFITATIPLSCTPPRHTNFQQVCTAGLKIHRDVAWCIPQSLVIGKVLHGQNMNVGPDCNHRAICQLFTSLQGWSMNHRQRPILEILYRKGCDI